ncbi:MAG: glycerol-3-phosphate acyltransferase [Anaerolineales bacterium]
MQIFPSLGVVVFGYVLGAIPFGYIFVKARTGKDIRDQHSGRTGGTNAMRAAGKRIGILTGILDILKGVAAAQLAIWLFPGNVWMATLTPLAAVIGHNYSFFLAKQDKKGMWLFGGGAGGATVGGGAVGLWLPSLYIMLPIALLIYYFVGYASVTTLSIGVMTTLIFVMRALLGWGPWEYVLYGLGGVTLMAWTLRPNIQRLLDGSERIHGYRARKQKAKKTSGRKSRRATNYPVRQG